MGKDIYGWVEVQHTRYDGYSHWRGVIQLSSLVERNYGIFGALFGVVNEDEFSPAFARRGLPDGLSNEARSAALIDTVTPDATWVLWSEFERLDWGMRGQETVTRGWLPDAAWQRAREDPAYEIIEEQPNLIRRWRKDEPNGEIETLTLLTSLNRRGEEEAYIARQARWRLEEHITPDWQTLFDMVALLAKRFGSSSVRFVVWFV
jgi:hypothetical protein